MLYPLSYGRTGVLYGGDAMQRLHVPVADDNPVNRDLVAGLFEGRSDTVVQVEDRDPQMSALPHDLAALDGGTGT